MHDDARLERMKERLGTACFGSADADDAEWLIGEYEVLLLATTGYPGMEQEINRVRGILAAQKRGI